MKKQKLIVLGVFLNFSLLVFSQQQYYEVTSGAGYGLRFWGSSSSNNYKIHMGSSTNYRYGPVTTYSIKMNMSDHMERGWTWGVVDQPPIAALNTEGTMQLAKDLRVLGSIGIGTTDPTQKLSISGGNIDLNEGEFYLRDDSGSEYGIGYNAYDASQMVIFSDNLIDFRESDNSVLKARFYLNSGLFYFNGKMGIGTTSPDEELEVVGDLLISGSRNIRINASGGSVEMNAPSSGGWAMGLKFKNSSGTDLGGWRAFGSNDNLNYYYVGDEYNNPLIAVKPNGSVGIGTSSPDYKLDVEGIIRTEEVIVETGWSDFVFEPDYNLMPLDKLEQFIEQNKHLPDVPSVEEVKENGLSLGESDAILLQKIEELTLYLIEQNKTQKKLINEIKALKRKIKKMELNK